MRIAIIGSGPAAVAVHSTLMKYRFPCSIVVIDREVPAELNNTDVGLPNNLKTFRGSNLMYKNLLETKEIDRTNRYLLGSQALGGFSAVWGAVTDPRIGEFGVSLLKNDHQYIEKLLFPSCNVVKAGSDYTIVRNELFLAVDQTLCTNCGECLLGCKFRAIWSAASYWENTDNLEFKAVEGVSFIESQDNDEITVFDSKERKIGIYDQVFLAAGALASLKILIESKILSKAKLSQNDLQIVPWFTFSPLKLNSLNLSLASLSFDVQKNGMKAGYVQLYANLENAKDLISNNVPLIKYVPDRIWSRLSRHLGVAFIYLNSEISREIEFSVESKKIRTRILDSIDKRKKRKEVAQITISFLKSKKLIPLNVLKRDEPVGRSFHVGSLKKLEDSQNFKGSFYGDRVVCVDGLALSAVDAGHITSQIMINAREITKTVIEKR